MKKFEEEIPLSVYTTPNLKRKMLCSYKKRKIQEQWFGNHIVKSYQVRVIRSSVDKSSSHSTHDYSTYNAY